jgi:hypothetical protein
MNTPLVRGWFEHSMLEKSPHFALLKAKVA